jgi:hypothetical protein
MSGGNIIENYYFTKLIKVIGSVGSHRRSKKARVIFK